jgi:hypothetical protein
MPLNLRVSRARLNSISTHVEFSITAASVRDLLREIEVAAKANLNYYEPSSPQCKDQQLVMELLEKARTELVKRSAEHWRNY